MTIEDVWETTNENAHGGFQLLFENKDGNVEQWQRIIEDIFDNAPRTGEEGNGARGNLR